MELLPEALGWLDARKRATLNNLRKALGGNFGQILAAANEDARAFRQDRAHLTDPMQQEKYMEQAMELAPMLLGVGGETAKYGTTKYINQQFNKNIEEYTSLTPQQHVEIMQKVYKDMPALAKWEPRISKPIDPATQGLLDYAKELEVKAGKEPKADFPSIEPSMTSPKSLQLPGATSHAPTETEAAALQQLEVSHGLSPENVRYIQERTGKSHQEIQAQYDLAQANAVRLQGLGPENTIAERAMAGGFGDPTIRELALKRGSNTARQDIKTPYELDMMSPTMGYKAPTTFASLPGSKAYATFGNVSTPLVMRGKENLFDANNPLHLEQFESALKDVLADPPKNLPSWFPHESAMYPGNKREPFRHTVEGIMNPLKKMGRSAWDTMELPEATYVLKEKLGFPGFLTQEQGPNVASFDSSAFRSPIAAFDPVQKGSNNIFASAAGLTPLVALLAALVRQQPDTAPQ